MKVKQQLLNYGKKTISLEDIKNIIKIDIMDEKKCIRADFEDDFGCNVKEASAKQRFDAAVKGLEDFDGVALLQNEIGA